MIKDICSNMDNFKTKKDERLLERNIIHKNSIYKRV